MTKPGDFSLRERPSLVRADPRLRWTSVAQVAPVDGSSTLHSVTTGKVVSSSAATKATRPTSVELFAGAGGLALGCEKAGFRSLATLEWDRWACDTMRQNKAAGHPLVKEWNVVQGDVRKFDWSSLPESVDLVSGGPPCQPFSAGGQARSVDDKRDMFPATAEILSELRPKAFLIENVRGLTRAALADYYEYVLRRLETPELKVRSDEKWFDHLQRLRKALSSQSLHYDVFPTLLDAADFGVPQRRHRVILVGFRRDLGVSWRFPEPTHSQEALVREQWITEEYWDEHRVAKAKRPERPSSAALARAATLDRPSPRWRTLRDAMTGLPDPESKAAERFRNHSHQPGARSYIGHTGSPLDEPAKTLKAGTHGVPGGENMIRFHDGSVRYLTVRESARVQTFPDDYELHGAWGEAMRQLGNAVPVSLAETLARHINERIHPANQEPLT